MSSSGGKGNFPLTFRLQVQGDQEVTNKFNKVKGSITGLNTSATGAKTSVTGVGTAAKTSGTSAMTSSVSIARYSGALAGVDTKGAGAVTTVGSFKSNIDAINGPLGKHNILVGDASSGLTGLSTEGKKADSAMGSLAQKFQGNRGLVFGMVGMATSGIEAVGMLQMWGDAAGNVDEAQARVNELIAQGAQNTPEYKDAVSDLQDAQCGYNFVLRNTILSVTDLIPFSLMFVNSLVNMKASAAGAATSTDLLTKATGKLRVAMSAITLTNPLLLALTAVSAIAIALITNVGGIRDKLHAFGQKIVEIVPFLKPLVDAFGHLGAGAEWVGKQLGFVSDEGDNYNDTQTAMTLSTNKTNETMQNQGDTVVVTADQINSSIESQISKYSELEQTAQENFNATATHYATLAEESEKSLLDNVFPNLTSVTTAMEGVEQTANTALAQQTVAHEATLTEETQKNIGLQLEQINAIREGYRLVVVSAEDFLVKAMAAKLQAAETRVGRFANNMQTAMEHIKRQAENATKGVNALKSAVDSLKSKTITIKVKYDVQDKPSGLAKGGSFISDTPQKINGVNISEGGIPELVSVMPLSKLGFGDNDKVTATVPLPKIDNQLARPLVNNNSNGSSRPIIIHNHLEVDGREIARNQVKYIPDRFNVQT